MQPVTGVAAQRVAQRSDQQVQERSRSSAISLQCQRTLDALNCLTTTREPAGRFCGCIGDVDKALDSIARISYKRLPDGVSRGV